ncbi:NAD-dependent epimerase/dehydratase family protein [Erwinia tasmaniensis]|uniref:NAD-dependent epimerase/dehydratase family protein n=1 Tax=Erwinia tasmaniensis (strain DSM 17950 / CFBP 7177 / CIP 109463 / NCPPB 4357 / Et1/99) TaxID=465817 RepID=B2VFM7_ERWT9|nr:NAD-dependent epimerase/dehydratase family protein [Erwinia tasmaniensis]CAO96383.1 NAD-dependent epimerase/dehydratase family protein [Erwinia tasmaniensis Et1/99]
MPTVLILGGSGFIGTNLIEFYCNKNYKVVTFGRSMPIIEHPNIEKIIGDIRNLADLELVFKNHKIDLVFHSLTSISATDSFASCQNLVSVNLSCLIDIISLMKKYSVYNMVYFSSGGSIYGIADTPINEEHELSPVSFYGWIKEVSERYLAYENRINSKFNYLILRPANVYGQYQKLNRIIGVALKNAIKKEDMHIYGDVNIRKDYIHIDDVCEMTYALVNSANSWNDIYNIGSGMGTSLKEILHYAEVISGNKMNLVMHNKKVGDISYSILDNSKVLTKIGKRSFIPVYEGMRSMHMYVHQQLRANSVTS